METVSQAKILGENGKILRLFAFKVRFKVFLFHVKNIQENIQVCNVQTQYKQLTVGSIDWPE